MRDEDFWHDFEAGRGGDGGEGIGAYQRMRLRLLQQVLLDVRHRQADRQTKDSTLSLTVNLLSLSASLSRAVRCCSFAPRAWSRRTQTTTSTRSTRRRRRRGCG